ncbi:tautomerase family protein [Mesorhizobium sp. 2RAF21]|uniref:tautomerase family protein n=1 Tax=Mesorhizobium sp. 2RAF21 TaxID=3232995 RepID=UPI003F980297
MPFIRVTYQTGGITAKQKAELAEDLTRALLVLEAGADTPEGRGVACVFFEEVNPTSDWFVGGKPDTNGPAHGRFLIDVTIPEGCADQKAKAAFHVTVNDSVARILGVDGTFPSRIGDWVMIREIANGSWGVGGVTVGIRDIAALLKYTTDKPVYFEGLLAAQKRLREAHGFPDGVSLL